MSFHKKYKRIKKIILSKYKSSLCNRFGVYFFYNSWFGVLVQTAERKRVRKFLDSHLKLYNRQAASASTFVKKGAHKIVRPFHLLSYYKMNYGYIFQ